MALAIVIFLLWIPCANAGDNGIPESVTNPLRLGIELPYAVLVDPTGTLTADVVTALPAERFTPQRGAFAAGFSRSAFWLRLDLPMQTRNGEEWWLALSPSFVDSVRVIEPTATGWRSHDGGALLPLSAREMDYRDFVYRIRPGGNRPLYIRVQNSRAVLLFGALWQPAAFATQSLPDARNWGIYFGLAALSSVIVISLAAFFRQRRFVVLMASAISSYLLVAGLQGFGSWLLLPDWPLLSSMSVSALVCVTDGMLTLLLGECLSLKRNYPRIGKLYLGIAAIEVLCTLSVPLGLYGWVANFPPLLTGLAALGALVLSVRLVILGNRTQIAFSVMFLAHLITGSFPLAINLGLMQPSRLLYMMWQYELIPHMMMIAVVFLFEIRKSHVQWMTEQNDALLSTREAQALLEGKVQDRTHDLSIAQIALQGALDGERHALFEQRQFMAMVAHEFRTPLAVIDAAAMNLLNVPPRGIADLQMRSDQLIRSSQRLVQLTDTCLADARLHDNAFTTQCCDVVLEKLVGEAVDIVRLSDGYTLITDLSEAPQHWLCDPALVRVALSNLLDNAIKYGGPGEIAVTVKQDEGALLIRVTDHGKGIADIDRQRIFERYQRGENAPKGKGSGLGLAVVKMIAEAHGGDIRITSSATGGGAFELSLR
jgi:two-component system, sensor histidine kinase LadS